MDVRSIVDTPTHKTFAVELTDAESTISFVRAATALSTKYPVKGFRPGQAPWNILEKVLSPDTLYQEVAKRVLNETLPGLLRTFGEKRRLGDPSIDFTTLEKGKNVQFTISVAFWPFVDLLEYDKLTVTQKRSDVTDNEIKEALDYLMQARKVKTIDDDFARSVGNFKNMDALKTSMREGILYDKTLIQREKSRSELLEKIRKETDIEIAPFIIDREAQKILDYEREQIKKNGSTVEEYLKNIGKSEQEFIVNLKEIAKKRLEQSLILYEIAQKEKIMVSEDEVDERLNRILSRFMSVEQAKTQGDPAMLKDRLYQQILEEKVFSEVLNKQIITK